MSESLWCHGLQHTRLPGFSISPEFAQIHVHWVGDVIQPSHPLSPPYPPAFDLSQHQGLFMNQLFPSGSQSIGASASVLPMTIQSWFPLGLIDLIFFMLKGLSRLFSWSEESIWRRNRIGRSHSLLQIHWKNNRTVNKVYKTTSDR